MRQKLLQQAFSLQPKRSARFQTSEELNLCAALDFEPRANASFLWLHLVALL